MNPANILLGLDLVLGLLQRAAGIQALIQTAQSEGRDITAEELTALRTADDVARKELEAVIKAVSA